MFGELVNSGSTPVLEAAMRFASQRQKLIASNIANFDTPGYQTRDVSVAGFQAMMREAIERRRESGSKAELEITGNGQIQPSGKSGDFVLHPEVVQGDLLLHDQSSGNLERLMQDQVENATAFRIAVDLLRTRSELMRASIAERP
jgi:flagellar basal-body rod protein FlgB